MAKIHPEMEPVAERIAKVKRLRNMTHAELADRLEAATGEDWTVGRVTNLLTARTKIDAVTLGHIAEIQAMPLDYYVHGEVTAGKARELLAGAADNGESENLSDLVLELSAA